LNNLLPSKSNLNGTPWLSPERLEPVRHLSNCNIDFKEVKQIRGSNKNK